MPWEDKKIVKVIYNNIGSISLIKDNYFENEAAFVYKWSQVIEQYEIVGGDLDLPLFCDNEPPIDYIDNLLGQPLPRAFKVQNLNSKPQGNDIEKVLSSING